MNKRGLRTQTELAEVIGKPSASVSRWIRGKQSPAFADLCEIADVLGWQMGDSETPPPEPPATAGWRPGHTIGHVWAKDSEKTYFTRDSAWSIESLDKAWEASPYWPFVSGFPISYADVKGDSMEPDYPEGSFLACSRPVSSRLPELTPVIARVGKRMAFKLFRVVKNSRGEPEVELLPVIQCLRGRRYRLRQVRVEYVVVGVVKPLSHVIVPVPHHAPARVRE